MLSYCLLKHYSLYHILVHEEKIDCKVTTRAKTNYKISKSQLLRKSSFLIGWVGVWLDVIGLSNKSVQSTQEKVEFLCEGRCWLYRSRLFGVSGKIQKQNKNTGIWNMGPGWLMNLLTASNMTHSYPSYTFY